MNGKSFLRNRLCYDMMGNNAKPQQEVPIFPSSLDSFFLYF